MVEYKIDYKKLRTLAENAGRSMKNLSLSIGKGHGYISAKQNQNGSMSDDVVQDIALLLDCRPSDFIDMDEPSEDAEEVANEIILDPTDMESEIEKFIRAKFSETLAILDELTEKVDALTREPNEVKDSNGFEGMVGRASTLLSKMLDSANGGSVKLSDFKSRCSIIGITDRDVIKQAIESTGCNTLVTGLGNDKIVWVFKGR